MDNFADRIVNRIRLLQNEWLLEWKVALESLGSASFNLVKREQQNILYLIPSFIVTKENNDVFDYAITYFDANDITCVKSTKPQTKKDYMKQLTEDLTNKVEFTFNGYKLNEVDIIGEDLYFYYGDNFFMRYELNDDKWLLLESVTNNNLLIITSNNIEAIIEKT